MKLSKTQIGLILLMVGLILSHILLARSAYIAGAFKACSNTDHQYLNQSFACQPYPDKTFKGPKYELVGEEIEIDLEGLKK